MTQKIAYFIEQNGEYVVQQVLDSWTDDLPIEEQFPWYFENNQAVILTPEEETFVTGWLVYAPDETPRFREHIPTRDELLWRASNKRDRVETGGITWNGIAIDTMIASQNRIANAVAYVTASGVESIDFKPQGGWALDTPPLPSAALIAIALAVGAHVQASFTAEKAVTLEILDGTITTYDQIEDSPHWTSVEEAQST